MNMIVRKIQLLIEQFVNSNDMSSFEDEAQFRIALAKFLSSNGVPNEEEKEIEMGGGKYRCDIVAFIADECIPVELKLNNTSIDEYKEDEIKCKQYVKTFDNVHYAFCVFVSNIEHAGYYQSQWRRCSNSDGYKYLVLLS